MDENSKETTGASSETHGLSRRNLLTGSAGVLALIASGLPLSAGGQDAGPIAARLDAMGIALPELSPPVASYVPYVVSGNEVHVAGQLPFQNGTLLYPGTIPEDVSVEQGREAARQCGINILAAVRDACEGDLERIERCIRLEGYVSSTDDFAEQSMVMNGASDLMQSVLGERGRHARIAVGASSLPLNACVEVAALFRIR